jgi:hypothetical protein
MKFKAIDRILPKIKGKTSFNELIFAHYHLFVICKQFLFGIDLLPGK